jgi:hypothetical protein
MPKEGETPSFYMASYLLYIICARNVFSGINLNWNSSELLVHVYFNILWDNKYKKSYTLICDHFIACIYFCCSGNNALGCQKKQKGLYPKWVTGI